MEGFILNPRRAPRAPVRCVARTAPRDGGFWESPTSDYGPNGCQMLAPLPLAAGTRIFVELANERVERPVQLTGHVAWTSKAPPWRIGVAFDAGAVPAATKFFERLAAAYPGLEAYARAPDRIPERASLAPAVPPETGPLLTDEEARVLRELGPGLRADALRERLGEDFDRLVNAVFALLGRRYLVLGEPDAGAAAGWSALLRARDEASPS